jgi:hypothetical protein
VSIGKNAVTQVFKRSCGITVEDESGRRPTARGPPATSPPESSDAPIGALAGARAHSRPRCRRRSGGAAAAGAGGRDTSRGPCRRRIERVEKPKKPSEAHATFFPHISPPFSVNFGGPGFELGRRQKTLVFPRISRGFPPKFGAVALDIIISYCDGRRVSSHSGLASVVGGQTAH